MSFKTGDKVRVVQGNSRYYNQVGTVVNTYEDNAGHLVELDSGLQRSFFNHELGLDNPLIDLAETLNNARMQANAIPEMAPQGGVYGDISQIMVEVLCTITGRFEVGDIYDSLNDGNTVREALALAEVAE
jgi:hypothetical protein